jgi:hypothetical protein
MRQWNLKLGDPRSLILAADARLCTPDYYNDQIWELGLGGGDPPAIALQTTFGLRARNFRIFPRFTEGDISLSNPEDFFVPPRIRRLYPNFLVVTFSPFDNIDVVTEYWAAQSQTTAGRIHLINRGNTSRKVGLELIALLMAIEGGQPMAPAEIQAAPVLSGRTADLVPVVFMTGGAKATRGSFPSLTLTLDILPGGSHQLIWSHAALPSEEESFDLARSIAAQNWDAEYARIEMLNQGQVDVHTGDVDWDAAFAITQKVAFNLFTGPTTNLPNPSLVQVRHPDYGYSFSGDGSDYGTLWNGQSALDTYTLADLILPAAPDLARGLLMNFLVNQDEDGVVDWKPGLGGQRGNRQAAPMLAVLAWHIYQHSQDQSFLEEVFPDLLKFIHAWFAPERDRDQDGIPEWDHPMQAGFEDHPLFARWHSWAKGIDITTVESPVLCAFLFRECQTLIQMAQIIGRTDTIPLLEALSDNLHSAVEASWNPTTSSYHYWDRDTHVVPSGGKIGERRGPGQILVNQTFEGPVRLIFHLNVQREATRRARIFIHGIGPSGNHHIERIGTDRFLWFLDLGTCSSERTYISIEWVEIQGAGENDRITIYSSSLDHQDHTLLLPLWAGIPSQDRAEALVIQTITAPNRFWRPFGLPACPGITPIPETPICHTVHIPWNNLVGEGLISYGFRDEAAQLVTNLMSTVISSLKNDGAFYRYYHAETGQGLGERDALGGLAPLSLFLQTLGVRLISPYQVALEGFNPFPWPITVKYKGLTILRQKEKTLVVFPDGQTSEINDPTPCIVAIEST